MKEQYTREQKAAIRRARKELGIPTTGETIASIVGSLIGLVVYLAVMGAIVAGCVWVIAKVVGAIL